MQRLSSHLFRSLLVGLALLGGTIVPAIAKNSVGPTAPAVVQTCNWDRPGVNPFMGDVVAAVDRYQDIPREVRERLKARMAQRTYDDVVTIRRDSIQGKARYGTSIRDMHFGTDKVCRTVTRSSWNEQMQERGLVYCEGGECILVPTVCRNVSRIARAQVAHERAEGEALPLDRVPLAPAGPPQAGFETALPTGLPMVNPSALASEAGPAGATFAAGAIAGGGGLAATHGGFLGSDLKGPSSVPAFSALPDTQDFASLTPVPEPETWCLLLVGLCALGAVARRRALAH